MTMQSYGTAPSRNIMNTASAPRKRGLIEKAMMMGKQEMKPMKKEMPMKPTKKAAPKKTVKKAGKKEKK